MSWIEQSPEIVLQTLLTILGSGVAIWIALFQQRATNRREQQSTQYKTRSVAPVLMRELLDLAIDISAKRLTLSHHEQILPGKTNEEVLAITRIELPNVMVPDLDTGQIFGPVLSDLLTILQVHISGYNSEKTIVDRLRATEEVFLRIRAVDKELGILVR